MGKADHHHPSTVLRGRPAQKRPQGAQLDRGLVQRPSSAAPQKRSRAGDLPTLTNHIAVAFCEGRSAHTHTQRNRTHPTAAAPLPCGHYYRLVSRHTGRPRRRRRQQQQTGRTSGLSPRPALRARLCEGNTERPLDPLLPCSGYAFIYFLLNAAVPGPAGPSAAVSRLGKASPFHLLCPCYFGAGARPDNIRQNVNSSACGGSSAKGFGCAAGLSGQRAARLRDFTAARGYFAHREERGQAPRTEETADPHAPAPCALRCGRFAASAGVLRASKRGKTESC